MHVIMCDMDTGHPVGRPGTNVKSPIWLPQGL